MVESFGGILSRNKWLGKCFWFCQIPVKWDQFIQFILIILSSLLPVRKLTSKMNGEVVPKYSLDITQRDSKLPGDC